MDLEQKYFTLFDEEVTKRRLALGKHFKNNFFEEYTKPDEREWYKQNISAIDEKIVEYANFISGILLLDKTFTKIADVFKDTDLNNWYNAKKIEANKQSVR